MGYFALRPHPPFRLDLTVWGLRRQAHNAMDVWEQDAYLRTWNYGE
ncbi:base excision DNA repair protein, partial [Acidithiobacillus caldus ATCC 51756]|nr:base excision DNA repair protein [Acidithiobacillus caldus ATCC 51756]